MKVKDAMHGVTKVSPSTNVVDAAVLMSKKAIGSVLIEEDNKLQGIVTERDIIKKVVAKGVDANKLTVKEIMSSPLITIDANSELSVASRMMRENKIRRLVVTENDKIVGIITTRDVSNRMPYSLTKDVTDYMQPTYF